MIVKPSTLLNTYHGRQWLAVTTIEELDEDLPYEIDPVLMKWLDELPVAVALSPADDDMPAGTAAGITTMCIETGEPAILLYYTDSVALDEFVNLVEHEMVHAQQVIDGRLSYVAYDEQAKLIWEGVIVDSLQPCLGPVDGTKEASAAALIHTLQYYSQPWEFEAVRGEYEVAFGGRTWPRKIVERYGTLWPKHWSAEYVQERLMACKSVHILLKEFAEEGY